MEEAGTCTNGLRSGFFFLGNGPIFGSGICLKGILSKEILDNLRLRLAALTFNDRALRFGLIGFCLRSAVGLVQVSSNALVAFHHYELSIIGILHKQ